MTTNAVCNDDGYEYVRYLRDGGFTGAICLVSEAFHRPLLFSLLRSKTIDGIIHCEDSHVCKLNAMFAAVMHRFVDRTRGRDRARTRTR